MDDTDDLLFRFRASYQKQDGTVEITSRAVRAPDSPPFQHKKLSLPFSTWVSPSFSGDMEIRRAIRRGGLQRHGQARGVAQVASKGNVEADSVERAACGAHYPGSKHGSRLFGAE